MDKSTIGDRFKDYESRSATKLLPRIPMIIRLDGVAFHTFTKQYKDKDAKDPFSLELKDAMGYAIRNTCNNVSGVKAVYQQSDEITFYLQENEPNSQVWYDYKVQKMCSVIAGMFSSYFNHILDPSNLGYFDARAFNVPDEVEVNNNLIWRQMDAMRNSVNMVGRHHFSHKQMMNKNTTQVKEMLKEKEIIWEDLELWKQRGSLYVRTTSRGDTSYIDKNGKRQDVFNVIRSKWEEVECPLFTEVKIYDMLEQLELEKKCLTDMKT